MNYNLATCHICQGFMTFQQVREAVYWLPDMDELERYWARMEGYQHKLAHRVCWKGLKEKKRALIRFCSYKNQVPRSLGQKV